MVRTTVAQARKVESIGRQVRLQGWVRTRRDSKGGFSFIELNDGSCLGNVQVIAESALQNYQNEVLHLSVGSSVTVEGTVQASPAKGQPTEVKAASLVVHGQADPARYPLQKKGHSMEFLREQAHLRPRSNTFGFRDARAQPDLPIDPRFLPRRERLPLRAAADHHRLRRRGRWADVPRHLPSTTASCRAARRERSTSPRISSAGPRI